LPSPPFEAPDAETGPRSSPALRDDHPRGYPALARFIGSDKDFFVFRRFNTLSARNLLFLQGELIELEERLQELDLLEPSSGLHKHCGTFIPGGKIQISCGGH